MLIKRAIPSFVDYPGEICIVIHTAGCNLQCPWCFNKDLVTAQEPFIPVEKVFEYLKLRRRNADAVCITGGEPTIQEGLLDFVREVKDLGYLVKLDTNGTNPEIIRELVPYLDYIAMDFKSPLYKYEKFVGCDVEVNVVVEAAMNIKHNVTHEFRTTVAPGLTEEDLRVIAQNVYPSRYFLQQYRPIEDSPFTPDELQRIAKEIGAGVRGI